MTREEYFAAIKDAINEHLYPLEEERWNDPEFQDVIHGMYDDFSQYTPAKQRALIRSAGPIEPFWQRVVMDAVYVYYMW